MFLLLNNTYTHKTHFRSVVLTNLIVRCSVCVFVLFYSSFALLISFILILFDIISLVFIFEECKIRTVISLYIMLYSVYIIVSSVITFVTNLYSSLILTAFIGVISSALVFCVVAIINKKATLIEYASMIPRNIKFICVVSVLSSAGAVLLLLNGRAFNSLSEWRVTTKILVVLFILIIGSVFPALIVSSVGQTYYNRQAKMAEKQLELQAKHYEEMAKNNFEIRRFKHDYKNILIGVQELIQKGDTQGAIELLSKENGSISEIMTRHYESGNGIVDTILSEKQKDADSINTLVKFEGFVPSERISPTDLCVIFGNTLDNAIEACEKVNTDSTKTINVSCRVAGGFMFVNITNPVQEDVQISNNTIKTSKSNKMEHGFGIYSLKKAVSKYNGTVKLSCADRVFSVQLELEIPS